MRPRVELPDLEAACSQAEDAIARATTAAMIEAVTGLKEDWRDQVRRAGLGNRLAGTVQARVYPGNRPSLDPAGYVYSKAPAIMESFVIGSTIVPVAGKEYLAIPTKNVPRRARGSRGGLKPITPFEVEVMFNQDLTLIFKRGSILAFIKVIQAKNKRGWRRATDRRLAQGRNVELVHMFTFRRRVKMPKKLSPEQLADHWRNQLPALVANNWR